MSVVMKFGGSSVATLDLMKQVASHVVARHQKEPVVMVISAMGKTTNQLVELAKQASNNPSKRELDMLLATGEQTSVALMTMILNDLGVKAVSLTGYQAGIKTEGYHTKNKIVAIDIQKIKRYLDDNIVVVVAGFQGMNESGDITTLGRGGSDTSAVALAAELGYDAEIYTNVDGVYTIDPRIYPNAKKLEQITYEEMKELSFLGAKVMEYHSLDIGERHHVKIYVASSQMNQPGTWIQEEEMIQVKPVTGVSISEQVLPVNIKYLPNNNKVVADVFVRLARDGVNVDMISESYSSKNLINLSFTVSVEDESVVTSYLTELHQTYPEIKTSLEQDMVKVSLVGSGMRTQSGIAAQTFQILAELDVAFRLVTTSEISISFTIPRKEKERVANAIASHFEL